MCVCVSGPVCVRGYVSLSVGACAGVCVIVYKVCEDAARCDFKFWGPPSTQRIRQCAGGGPSLPSLNPRAISLSALSLHKHWAPKPPAANCKQERGKTNVWETHYLSSRRQMPRFVARHLRSVQQASPPPLQAAHDVAE